MKRGRGRPSKSTKVEKSAKVQSKKRGTTNTIFQGSKVENDLILLWICFEESDGIKEGQTTIDYTALGKRLGLSYAQAKSRYYLLRSRVQKLISTVTSDKGPEDQPAMESEQENESAAPKKEEKLAKDEQEEDTPANMEGGEDEFEGI
ncbi:hypothetical protein N7509_006125 [Penicillium cosmopolitanum]|uniref:Uncharacterized protein n=1 Tax=Penicillium cosmopolitanum TaxID=1131564 RepID=A0A9X0BAQ3_9EURO|nr:uncharacterized protein N7509_006125 [Penicillium cosmopolitanum]KAJ5398012.1 hypothetical protein N7509_006125 [Penicillium cosmopolitanum]